MREINFGRISVMLIMMGWATTQPMLLQAQSTQYPVQADNSAYIGPGTSQNLGGSVALVDASQYFAQEGNDICATINYIVSYANGSGGVYGEDNSNGVVVDARGINVSPGQTLACAHNPFSGVYDVSQGFSITVLLPASTIAIQQTWILPESARIIGQGEGVTVIQACNGCFTGGGWIGPELIDMGTNNTNFCGQLNNGYDCSAVGIEHLTIDANNQTSNSQAVDGIVNPYSQELSYVKDVAIINVPSGGTGLWLAQHDIGNSGPYSDIYFSGSGTCAQIFSSASGPSDSRPLPDTRGIHGLTCAGNSVQGTAIMVDGSYNSLEDIYITGYTEGILVGSRWSAQGNLIFNVTGGSGMNDVIHIASTQTLYSNCPPGIDNQVGNPTGNNVYAPTVCDLTIAAVTSSGTYSIQDDLTGIKLTDSNVGIYALGELTTIPSGSGVPSYSRFTTSPSVPAWFVGAAPSSGSACSTGSLYSATSGSAPTVWGCVASKWKAITTY
jgi:hypothetical protein